MKLRNKYTREINIVKVDEDYFNIYKDDGEFVCPVTLKELNDGWEDYEEPSEIYFISSNGQIHEEDGHDRYREERKEIGNYFETEEEAEKAVEKLKALTEAKEDGLKIKGYYYNHEDLVILADIGKCNKLTLDTLFGKETD